MPRSPVLAVLAVLLSAASALAQSSRFTYGKAPMAGDQGPREPAGVGFTQKLGAALPADVILYDHDDKPVTLPELANGKPTILCLGYYRCPKLCNQVQGNLLQALRDLRESDPAFTAGGAFNVVMVTVDPREDVTTYSRPKRLEYLKNYDGRSPETPGWWFLTANSGQGTDVAAADREIHKLADAVGFNYTLRARGTDYTFDPAAGMWRSQRNETGLPELPRNYDYNHSSGVVLLTPDGRVSSYLLGLNFDPKEVRTSVVMASGGTVGTFFERNVSPYCQVYDDVKGHYKPTLRVLAWVFTPVMLFVVYLAAMTVRKARREPVLLPGQAAPPAV